MTQENELYVLHRNGKIDWDSEQVCSNVPGDTLDDTYEWVLFAAAPVALGGEPPCNPHPDAPHGYNRNASHNAGRYVCDCEGWAAMGGEKGEADLVSALAACRDAFPVPPPGHPAENDWAAAIGDPESVPHFVRAMLAAPVGKARMLTDEEADHITGMHNTGRAQGDSECAEAIQRKFCEVNGITLEAK